MIFSRWFDGLDTGSKDKEYGKFMFLFNRKLSCLGINDAHLYSSYSLNKIILDHSPVFFGLVEAGNSQPGSGLLPRQPQDMLRQLPESRDLNPLQITHMEYEDPDQLQKTEETQASSHHMKFQTISRGKKSMPLRREQ